MLYHKLQIVTEAAAVLVPSFVLIDIDDLTQVAEVANDRFNEFSSCNKHIRKHSTVLHKDNASLLRFIAAQLGSVFKAN